MPPHPSLSHRAGSTHRGGSELRRALFVDRWGTLLAPPAEQGPRQVAAEAFTPRALEALFRACQDGWSIYLIGNEEDVALGKLSDARWEAFERELLAFLGSYGVRVQRNYACLDDPLRGKGRHKRDSVYLLPNTGAMYHARQHDGVDLQKSWVIGDGVLELVAGWRAGCRLAGVGSSGRLEAGELAVEPELFRPDLASVLAEVLRPER